MKTSKITKCLRKIWVWVRYPKLRSLSRYEPVFVTDQEVLQTYQKQAITEKDLSTLRTAACFYGGDPKACRKDLVRAVNKVVAKTKGVILLSGDEGVVDNYLARIKGER